MQRLKRKRYMAATECRLCFHMQASMRLARCRATALRARAPTSRGHSGPCKRRSTARGCAHWPVRDTRSFAAGMVSTMAQAECRADKQQMKQLKEVLQLRK
eukprot:2570998-Pleurochrysis_carterae.AAC.3